MIAGDVCQGIYAKAQTTQDGLCAPQQTTGHAVTTGRFPYVTCCLADALRISELEKIVGMDVMQFRANGAFNVLL